MTLYPTNRNLFYHNTTHWTPKSQNQSVIDLHTNFKSFKIQTSRFNYTFSPAIQPASVRSLRCLTSSSSSTSSSMTMFCVRPIFLRNAEIRRVSLSESRVKYQQTNAMRHEERVMATQTMKGTVSVAFLVNIPPREGTSTVVKLTAWRILGSENLGSWRRTGESIRVLGFDQCWWR